MGHDKMTKTGDLDKVGFNLFGNKFLGTFPQDKLPNQIYGGNKKKYAIINVDTSVDKSGNPMRGSHWVAVSNIPGKQKLMVFDSFGRSSKDLLKTLYHKSGGNIIDTDYDKEQKLAQDSCGQFALAWLMFRDKYGLKSAQLI